MSFEDPTLGPRLGAQPPRKIAVIGAGISGMGAAHMLGDTDHVTLFEAGSKLGGMRAR